MIYVILAYISAPLIFLLRKLSGKRERGSILVFQTAKIGDMICTTPVFREIKKAYPKGRLGVVIDPVTLPLIKNNPHIDEIIIFDRNRFKGLIGRISFARSISKKGYSAALVLMPNIPNLISAFWAMIPERVSVYPDYTGRTLKKALALSTDVEYHVTPRMSTETYLRALAYLDIKCSDITKEVYFCAGAEEKASEYLEIEGPYTGLVLGTGNELKDWGKDHFLNLGRMLLEKTDQTLVLLGSEKDRDKGEELMGFSREFKDRILNLCGDFSLEELPALIKRMSLVIGVDTGLIYMADALEVPVIVIAGPCNMSDQRPTGKKSCIVQEKGIDCVPCSHTFSTPYKCRFGHKACVVDISAAQVFKYVEKIVPVKNRKAQ